MWRVYLRGATHVLPDCQSNNANICWLQNSLGRKKLDICVNTAKTLSLAPHQYVWTTQTICLSMLRLNSDAVQCNRARPEQPRHHIPDKTDHNLYTTKLNRSWRIAAGNELAHCHPPANFLERETLSQNWATSLALFSRSLAVSTGDSVSWL